MSAKPPNHALSPVPCPRRLDDIDLFVDGAQEHWYEAYPILHREAPVQVLKRGSPDGRADAFVLTRYADIERVVKDPERFTPVMSVLVHELQRMLDAGITPPADPSLFNVALESVRTLRPTAELWRAHRQELTDPWVGPGAKRHAGMIRDTANALIDRWIDRRDGSGNGRVEFIKEFARPLPQIVTATILGFPLADLAQLEDWGGALVMQYVYGKTHLNILDADQAAKQARRLSGFSDYVRAQISQKRAAPADDMISALTTQTYQALGRRLTDDEIYGVVYFMILGGLETTQYAIEQQAQLLCEDAALFQQLQNDPGLLRAFTEEAMRLRAPTQGLSTRITTRDEEFQGVTIPAGSYLHIRFAAGNVDPAQYDCPYRIDLSRKALGNHLTFSLGPRTCPGAGISRLEQQVAWECLLARLDMLDFAPGNTFVHQPGIMLGTLNLELVFRKARA